MKVFKRQDSDDQNLEFVQDNIERAFLGLAQTNPILEGQYIEGIALVSGTAKVINHQLGRILKGWFIGRISALAIIWDSQSTNSNPSKTLILNTSTNVTISIWVF